jgi:hypothetical protein
MPDEPLGFQQKLTTDDGVLQRGPGIGLCRLVCRLDALGQRAEGPWPWGGSLPYLCALPRGFWRPCWSCCEQERLEP